MNTHLNRALARVVAPLAVVGALATASIALAGSATAADKVNPFCTGTDPDTGFSDPTCGPFHYGSTGGSAGAPPTGDVTTTVRSQWDAPLWTGTYSMVSRADVFRSGTASSAPYVTTTTTFASSSIFGFHGCVEVFADDSSHRVVYDSGTRRVGVDGGETYTLTFGSRFATPAQASSVVSLLVVQRQC
jgi:hypothetical protein